MVVYGGYLAGHPDSHCTCISGVNNGAVINFKPPFSILCTCITIPKSKPAATPPIAGVCEAIEEDELVEEAMCEWKRIQGLSGDELRIGSST